jgi:rhodanese-related sulfurtransferase
MQHSCEPIELAKALKEDPEIKLLDVREFHEFEWVHLPTARLLPLSELAARYHELNDWKDSKVVVYCHHGIRSMHAIQFLKMQGFTNTVNLTGGIDAWSLAVDSNCPRY